MRPWVHLKHRDSACLIEKREPEKRCVAFLVSSSCSSSMTDSSGECPKSMCAVILFFCLSKKPPGPSLEGLWMGFPPPAFLSFFFRWWLLWTIRGWLSQCVLSTTPAPSSGLGGPIQTTTFPGQETGRGRTSTLVYHQTLTTYNSRASLVLIGVH